MYDFYLLISIVVMVLGILLMIAQFRLFSIDRTLKIILSQVQKDNKSLDFHLKMLLFVLRGDKAAEEQLENERKRLSEDTQLETIRHIKPEVLERLRQEGRLPKKYSTT